MYKRQLYAYFVSAFPAAEYSLEFQDLNLKQVYDHKEILHIARSRYETLQSSFGKSKGSSKSPAIVGKGGNGFGGKGGTAHGKGKGGNGNASLNGGAGKSEGPMRRCLRCKAAGHYSDSCNAKLCKKCGGRRHESSKCASRWTWTNRWRKPLLGWWRIPEMMPWRRRHFRGTAGKALRWECNRGHSRHA